jgi:hypothetical protein
MGTGPSLCRRMSCRTSNRATMVAGMAGDASANIFSNTRRSVTATSAQRWKNRSGRAGGRLGEILHAQGLVSSTQLSVALAAQRDLPSLVPEYVAVPVLPRAVAYDLRAVVMAGPDRRTRVDGTQLVAITNFDAVPRLAALSGAPLEPRLTDARSMDALLADAYVHIDGPMVAGVLRRTEARRFSKAVGLVCLTIAALGLTYLHPLSTLDVAVAVTGASWLVAASTRIRLAASGKQASSHIPAADAERTRERLECTVLMPLSRSSPCSHA